MSTLDELMSKDPLELSAQDIDAIIAYQRKARANFDSGIKPSKREVTIDAKGLLDKLGLAPKAPSIKRRKIT